MITAPSEQHGEKSPKSLTEMEILQIIMRGKWRLPVLAELQFGARRLSELRRIMPQASKKMLIDTLNILKEYELIQRAEYPEKVKRVEYSIHPRNGEITFRIIERLTASQVKGESSI